MWLPLLLKLYWFCVCVCVQWACGVRVCVCVCVCVCVYCVCMLIYVCSVWCVFHVYACMHVCVTPFCVCIRFRECGQYPHLFQSLPFPETLYSLNSFPPKVLQFQLCPLLKWLKGRFSVCWPFQTVLHIPNSYSHILLYISIGIIITYISMVFCNCVVYNGLKSVKIRFCINSDRFPKPHSKFIMYSMTMTKGWLKKKKEEEFLVPSHLWFSSTTTTTTTKRIRYMWNIYFVSNSDLVAN